MQLHPPSHPLRAWRRARGYSLRALAAALCDARGRPVASYATLQRVEAGLQDPPWALVRALHEFSDGALQANHFLDGAA